MKLSKEENHVLQRLIDEGRSDREIGEILGLSKSAVKSRRIRLGISKEQKNKNDPQKYREYEKLDDANLDRGICRINLYGDELERYLFVKKFKERAENYHVPENRSKICMRQR